MKNRIEIANENTQEFFQKLWKPQPKGAMNVLEVIARVIYHVLSVVACVYFISAVLGPILAFFLLVIFVGYLPVTLYYYFFPKKVEVAQAEFESTVPMERL